MDSGFGVGVLLGRSFTLDELVSTHGGSASEAVRRRSVDRIVAPRHASRDTDLVIVTSPRFAQGLDRVPGTLFGDPALAARLDADRTWTHPHVWWTVARLVGPERDAEAGVDAAARVDPAARVASTARIRAGAVVHAGARIGAGSLIEDNAVIYGGSILGDRVRVGPGSVIGRPGFGFAEGPGGQTLRIPQRGGVVLCDDVEVGAVCTVDAGTLSPTIIGKGSKLDAHVHVGHNVEIGEGVLVAAQVGFAGSAVIGRGVRIGGQTGIADHVTLGDGARVAAKSGVIGDIAAGSVVAGFPAVPRVRWLRSMAALLRLSKGRAR